MFSVFTVLLLLLGIINYSNYKIKDRASDRLISIISENGGQFPQETPHAPVPPKFDSEISSDDPEDVDDSDDPTDDSDSDGNEIDDDRKDHSEYVSKGHGSQGLSPEAPYETRFFTVSFNIDGQISDINTGRIAAIISEKAAAIAEDIHRRGESKGYIDNYKFLRRDDSSGTHYVFLDCTRDLDSVRQFLQTSILVGAAGFVAISALIVLLSPLMIRPIVESYDKQKKFITDAGHEIKTPLAVMLSCADVIEMEQGKSKWIDGIKDQIQKLGILTENLISLARMEEASGHFSFSDVDLSDILIKGLGPFILSAEQRGLKLTTDIASGVHINGDRHALSQLISILADNAVKYSSGEGDIQFRLYKKGRAVIITCANQAEGLSIGRKEAFFDRFYRGDASRGGETKGYGIGLSMARSIVETHGGKIEASSDDGKTLTVKIKL